VTARRLVFLVIARTNVGLRILAGYSSIVDAKRAVRQIRTSHCFNGETLDFNDDSDIEMVTRDFYDHLG